MKDISLDDLSLFLAVVDAGSLSGAAAATGVSSPTLSRKMKELERTTGRHLFRRGTQGFVLTAEGRELNEEAKPLLALSRRLAGWSSAPGSTPRVRITAGTWTSRFLARNISRVWKPSDPWVPEFLAGNANMDIARQEADIGIRSKRPEQPWLAGRRTSKIAYATYAVSKDITGYIAMAETASSTPSDRWIKTHHPDRIVTTVNSSRLALDLARAGMGRMIMPVFAGDDDSQLIRISDAIGELEHEVWLVSHHELRHDPAIRRALNALGRLLTMDVGLL